MVYIVRPKAAYFYDTLDQVQYIVRTNAGTFYVTLDQALHIAMDERFPYHKA